LLVALGGGFELDVPVDGAWRLKASLDSASAVDFLIGDRVIVNGPTDARAGFRLERPADPSGLPNVFPDRRGPRLEFDRIALFGELGSLGAGLKLALQRCALVLCGKDGDGFIDRILPGDETRFDFDLVVGLATGRGYYIEGGTGLQALILGAGHRTYWPWLRSLICAFSVQKS